MLANRVDQMNDTDQMDEMAELLHVIRVIYSMQVMPMCNIKIKLGVKDGLHKEKNQRLKQKRRMQKQS
jgi:hypothetical protein